jgi:hypothetical protein
LIINNAKILEQQAEEELESEWHKNQIQEDSAVAELAERTAKEAEKLELEKEKLKNEKIVEEEKKRKLEKENSINWVKKSRPGTESKPGANLKTATTSTNNDATSNKQKNKNSRERIPKFSEKTSGGSYYGSNSNNINNIDIEKIKEENKKKETEKKLKETNKISSSGGNRRREIENKLNEKITTQIMQDLEEKKTLEIERIERYKRFSISRKYAKPVEKILNIYNNPHTDLYMVLNVKRDVSDAVLKKNYRLIAMNIHPGLFIIFYILYIFFIY